MSLQTTCTILICDLGGSSYGAWQCQLANFVSARDVRRSGLA
jgi:hypothetical protein